MHCKLPTPKDLTGIRGRMLSYLLEAPHFRHLRLATTYDFSGDDVLKTIEDGILNNSKKVAAKVPKDPERPARWLSYVQDARHLLSQGDVKGSMSKIQRLQDEYYGNVSSGS